MSGFITKRELVTHPILMFRLCGLCGMWAVLTAERGLPFLTVLSIVGRI